ncbi:MAG: right-handed parallel beta-helix repeat-containing protein [Actinomycetota bacterium]|nr:right-handed parallel beta-helix repeat-containing protein [Actinomycetota bacterium]
MTEPGPVAGGREISSDTVLDDDLVPGEGPALVIVADGVTLDLGGHTLSAAARFRTKGPGILLRGVSGCTVRNGTVQNFEAGVAVEGGSGNLIEGLTVQDNIGSPDGDFGDGIVINDSRENIVRDNLVRGNGPFSGISLGRGASGNQVVGNTVSDNNMSDFEYADAGRQTMGIRIEGPAASHNRILDNTVTGSGCDGIVVLATCDNPDDEPPCVGTPPNEHNEIVGNTSSGNGTSGRGCGVRLFSMPLPMPPVHNVVRDNVADNNTSYGIALDGLPLRSPGNQAIGNRGHGNGEFDGSDGTLMPPCGKNLWADNDFGTVNQPCVSRRSEAEPGAETL